MKCKICGAEMKKIKQYDYITYKCTKCGHAVAVNTGVISIIIKAWRAGYRAGFEEGYIKAVVDIGSIREAIK